MHEGYQVSSLPSQEMYSDYLSPGHAETAPPGDRWSRLLKARSSRVQRIVTLLLVFDLVPSLVPEFG